MTKKKPAPLPVTWAQAFQTITVKAITSGNLVRLGILAAVCLFIWKMDGRSAVDIVKLFVNSSFYHTLGWVLVFVLTGGYVWSVRSLQKTHDKEIARLVTERNALQAELTERRIQSSLLPKNIEMK